MEQIQEWLRFIVDNEALLVSAIGTITTLIIAVAVAVRSLWSALRNVADAVETINPSTDNPVKITSRKLKEGEFAPVRELIFKMLTKKYK